VMLQQTRVETVTPYYRRWLDRFPDLGALADAELDDVLTVWQGLGYYARARNLHRAARLVRERHRGELPRDVAALRALPGVGSYTAGAVASIAFGVPAPAVDGNARRVLARLFDLEQPSTAVLSRLAAGLVDPDRPGEFNQALMELGAMICAPRDPECGVCPLRELCAARAAGTVEQRPGRRPKSRSPEIEVGVAVLLAPDCHVLVVRRPPTGLLGGLWEFPGEPLRNHETARSAAARAAIRAGVKVRSAGRALSPVPHAFSHLKTIYRPVLFRPRSRPPATQGRWVRLDRLDALPLPVAQRKIAAALPLPSSGGD
ncbi:MAG: A/G-specific adenine glycosylase, partial [Gemmatimonadetes bacterium]|nr:A/G-specific adenine glycosylase [Gemmatimonadota bacterium]